jgi:hypothetical protein
MRGEINLKKCLACGDKITKGLFCAKHANVVADALRMTDAAKGIDRIKLKAEAEARYAAHQAKKGTP